MICDRKFFATQVSGTSTTLADLNQAQYNAVDTSFEIIPPSVKYQEKTIATVSSLTLQLPDGYTNDDYLLVVIRCNGVLRATIASPIHTTSTSLIYGTTTVHGHLSVTDRVTSILLENPTASTVTVQYALVFLPDLTDSSSYLDYNLATGILSV